MAETPGTLKAEKLSINKFCVKYPLHVENGPNRATCPTGGSIRPYYASKASICFLNGSLGPFLNTNLKRVFPTPLRNDSIIAILSGCQKSQRTVFMYAISTSFAK